ncbi:MAG TPA: ABC transporter substrate-binding protein [Bdellovibrio sp.]|uniref:substrate-binding periplasmic protein n=1 Tax=Bdellovibrio sp. TaxID=28201 RepID=UPI002F0E1318
MKSKVLAVLVLFFSLSSFAQVEKCVRIFRVSSNDYAPLFFLTKDNKPAGYSHDLFEELKNRIGCDFVLEAVPAPRAINDFSNYRTDIAGLSPHVAMLDQWGEYVPLYKTARILVINKKFYDPKKTIEDYLRSKSMTFADQIGGSFFYQPAELDLLRKSNRLIEAPNPISSYRFIKANRIQGFFSSPVLHRYFLRGPVKAPQMQTLRDPSHKLEVGIYLSKKKLTKLEHDKIIEAIKAMKQDGTLKKLLLPYLDKEDVPYYEDL